MSDRVVGQKWLEKVQLICKPEQSGKTFIMIQQLIQDLSDPIPGKQIINIIFTLLIFNTLNWFCPK